MVPVRAHLHNTIVRFRLICNVSMADVVLSLPLCNVVIHLDVCNELIGYVSKDNCIRQLYRVNGSSEGDRILRAEATGAPLLHRP